MVDETPDTTHQEHEFFSLHYVDSRCTVQERFIGVHEMMQADSQSLVVSSEDMYIK